MSVIKYTPNTFLTSVFVCTLHSPPAPQRPKKNICYVKGGVQCAEELE